MKSPPMSWNQVNVKMSNKSRIHVLTDHICRPFHYLVVFVGLRCSSRRQIEVEVASEMWVDLMG